MKIQIGARTDVGMQRQHNEDNYVVCPDLKGNNWFFDNRNSIDVGNLGSLLVVADGMGGTNAGEVASELAIEAVKDYFSKNLRVSDTESQLSIRNFLKKSILSAQDRIIDHHRVDPSTEGMGTTIVMVWLLGSEVHVAWVGDSRCYRFDQERLLDSLSKDHSYVQELVDKGEINEEQAFYHPDGNIISQSLGDPEMRPQPSLVHFPIHEGQKIMLCSDGLNSMLKDEEIQAVFTTEANVNSCTTRLVELANEAGGYDNITVVIAEIMKTSGTPAKASAFNKFGIAGGIIALLAIVALSWLFLIKTTDIPYAPISVADSIKVRTLAEGAGEIIQVSPGDTIYAQTSSSGVDTFLFENGSYIRVQLVPVPQDQEADEETQLQSGELEQAVNESSPDTGMEETTVAEGPPQNTDVRDTVMSSTTENPLLTELTEHLLEIKNKSGKLVTNANDSTLKKLQDAVGALLRRCDQMVQAGTELQINDIDDICGKIEEILATESQVNVIAGNQTLTAEMAALREAQGKICQQDSASP